MPRNDQIIRQWHLLRRLEGSKAVSLDQLVESIPDDYPKNARAPEAMKALGFRHLRILHRGVDVSG